MKSLLSALACSFCCAALANSGTYESECFSVDTSLTLDVAPKSCNWEKGSIVIKWTSVCSSITEKPTYTVYWADNTNDFDSATFFDECNGNLHCLGTTTCTQTGSSELTYLDEGFSKQGDGTQIIYYCVKGSDGSKGCCATRRRFGLFVGFTNYENKDKSDWVPPSAPDANALWNDYINAGGMDDAYSSVCLWDENATCKGLDLALKNFATRVSMGDVFLFNINTHGVSSNHFYVGVLCYDGYYLNSDLKISLDNIGTKGAAVISVLSTCGSGQISKICGSENNKAWITATEKNESSWHIRNTGIFTGTEFSYFGLSFLTWGWERGLAASSGIATFYDLANYARKHTQAISSDIRFYPSTLNDKVLGAVVAFSNIHRQEESKLSAPNDLNVVLNFTGSSANVNWKEVTGAAYYRVFWKEDGKSDEYWMNVAKPGVDVPSKTTHFVPTYGRKYFFRVAGVNSAGVGNSSSEVNVRWESKISSFVRDSVEWYYTLSLNNIMLFRDLTEPSISAFTLGDIEVPQSIQGTNVVAIGSYAFYGCDKITGLTVPETVYSVGERAFEGCDSLTTVTFKGELPSGLAESGLLSTSANIFYPHKYAAQYADVIPAEKFGGYSDADTYTGATMSLGEDGEFLPIDSDGDGQYDQLVVHAQITTDKGGDYNWSATLEGEDGEEIVIATGEFSFAVGSNAVEFSFDASDILNSVIAGPYTVKDIIIWNDDDFVQLTGTLQSGEIPLSTWLQETEFSGTLFVRPDGDDSADGSSWESAKRTIQAAIDAATGDNMVVRVYPGTYDYIISTNRCLTIQSVMGAERTIIQGSTTLSKRAATLMDARADMRIYAGGFHGTVNVEIQSTLVGFTLTGGHVGRVLGYFEQDGSVLQEDSGGGVYGGIVKNCIISNNFAVYRGAGAFKSHVIDCLVAGNYGTQYGGGCCNCTIERSRLTNNKAYTGGGAWSSGLSNCLIDHNSCHVYETPYKGSPFSHGAINGHGLDGGGVCLSDMDSCTVVANSAQNGGGAYSYDPDISWSFPSYSNGPHYARNCIIVDNETTGGGDEICLYACNNVCSTTIMDGDGNIEDDPLFIDRENGDYRLQGDSPCVNAGCDDFVGAEMDADGNCRVVGSSVDIGAFEYQTAQDGAYSCCAGGYTWYFDVEDGCATIRRENDYGDVVVAVDPELEGTVSIPATLGGDHPVVGIGDGAFRSFINLDHVTLPRSVTTIGSEAFRQCIGMKSIDNMEQIASIGDFAFWGCSALDEVMISENVEIIGDDAFGQCSARLNFAGEPPSVPGYDVGSGCTGYFKSEYADAWMAEMSDGYWYDVEMHCEEEYTVHFDANNGDGEMCDIWMPSNYSFELPYNEFEREGYEFDGWSYSSDATLAELEDGETVGNLTSSDEVTLYAHWKGNAINVTFNYGPFADKFEEYTREYTVGAAFHDFPMVTSAKWHVKGWYTQPVGGERCDGGDVLPFLEDGTLYLQAEYLGDDPDPGDNPWSGESNVLSIVTAQLPNAVELEWYESQLEYAGGVAPYSWSVDEEGYLVTTNASTFAEVGEAQGWYEDDETWTCDLPFTFNYCGKGYDSVTVGDNGFVQFDVDGESKIAMDDNDLYSESEGQDIFVEKDENHVTFRWNRVVYSESENVVNCSITLNSNGVIRCSFGEGYDTSHEVSLSDAALEDGYVAYDVEDGEDLVLTLGFFPDGLSLDADTGVISGTPNVAGHYEFEVNVSDGAGSACTKTLTLDVAVNPDKKRDGSYSETIDGYTWYYKIENGEATLVMPDEWNWSEVDGDFIIPDTLGGCPVVGIGDNAFYCSRLTGGVVIPDSIESIGYYAFRGVITNLSIGASVCAISSGAFCSAQVKRIALDPDNGCFELQGDALYTDDRSELLLVASEATELQLPAEMTSDIPSWMFTYCSTLASIAVEPGNARYETRNGLLYDTDNDSIVCAPRNVAAVTCSVPEGTKVILSSAFTGCDYQTVQLPEGLLAIEEGAFNDCSNLAEITLPDSLVYVGYDAFLNTTLLDDAVGKAEEKAVTAPIVHDGWLLTYYYGDDFNGKLVVPDGVRALADSAICNDGLEELTLPASVDIINVSALICYSLKAIRFKGDVPTKIGAFCYYGDLAYYYGILSLIDPDAVCYIRTDASGWTDENGDLPEYWPLDPEDPENTEYARPLRYWTTCEPTMTIARDVGGGNCRVALASETEGAIIRYTTDGSEPNALSSVYGGEITISADTTIKAYATSADLPDSEVVAWEVSAQSELPLYWSAATNDGAHPWFEICQTTSLCAMQSGNVGHNGISTFEIATNGALEISFSWMASSEQYYDKLVFYVDDEEVATISGESEWEDFQHAVEENGEHVLRWSYEKDEIMTDGDDCGRLKDMVITVTEAYDPIPDLGDEPTEEEVYEALVGSADEMLAECITNAANYNAYREWAESVKGTNGTKTAGAQAVKDSPNAWVSFALGSDKLLEKAPKDEDLTVEAFEPSSEAGKFDFTVSVEGVEVGSEAQEENLKQVFGLEGAATLNDDAFSSGNVDLTFGTPEGGKVKFTAGPKDTAAQTFFMKVKVK